MSTKEGSQWAIGGGIERFYKKDKYDKPQTRALNYKKKRGASYLVLAVHTEKGRYFIACTFVSAFWELSNLEYKQRRHHEIIPTAQPCNLFVDIDANLHLNPHLDAKSTCKRVLTLIYAKLHTDYGIEKSSIDTVELDASNSAKISRHYIFNIRDVQWQSAAHCGAFIKQLIASIDRSDARNSCLFAKKKVGSSATCVLDTDPYGRNHSLRTYGSGTPTEPHRTMRRLGESLTSPLNSDVFFRSLITLFTNLSAANETSLTTLEHCWESNKPDSLSLSWLSDLRDLSVRIGSGSSLKRRRSFDDSNSSGSCDVSYEGDLPDVCTVIANKLWGASGWYGGCFYWSTATFCFSVLGRQFCEIAGREHESNHIKMVVLLRKNEYYQTCHDEDCSDFKGENRRLPEKLTVEIDDFFHSEEWIARGGSKRFADVSSEIFQSLLDDTESDDSDSDLLTQPLETAIFYYYRQPPKKLINL